MFFSLTSCETSAETRAYAKRDSVAKIGIRKDVKSPKYLYVLTSDIINELSPFLWSELFLYVQVSKKLFSWLWTSYLILWFELFDWLWTNHVFIDFVLSPSLTQT